MTTLEELEKRVAALEDDRSPGLRRAVVRIGELLEETRLRVSAIEVRLEGISTSLALLTANQAQMRGSLEARISAVEVRTGSLETKIDGLRRDLPGIVADSLREALKEQRRS
jgi:hypothetical protein